VKQLVSLSLNGLENRAEWAVDALRVDRHSAPFRHNLLDFLGYPSKAVSLSIARAEQSQFH